MLAAVRNLVVEANHVAAGRWTRISGNELCGKTLAIVGFGRIGKEVAIRARAFGLNVIGFGNYWDEDFARWYDIKRVENFEDVLKQADIISLHTKLTAATKGLINAKNFPLIKKGAVIVNTTAAVSWSISQRWSMPLRTENLRPTQRTFWTRSRRQPTTPFLGSRM